MPWLNGRKINKNCCKYCSSPYHRGWQCRQNPKNIAKMNQPKPIVQKSSNLCFKRSKRRVKTHKDTSRAKLIKNYDALFSKYCRLKAQINNNLFCFTCGKRLSYNDAVMMHFIGRRFVSVRFNEDNVHIGCIKCNCPDIDQPEVLRRYAERLGEEVVAELNLKKKQKISTPELKENYEALREKYNNLLSLARGQN